MLICACEPWKNTELKRAQPYFVYSARLDIASQYPWLRKIGCNLPNGDHKLDPGINLFKCLNFAKSCPVFPPLVDEFCEHTIHRIVPPCHPTDPQHLLQQLKDGILGDAKSLPANFEKNVKLDVVGTKESNISLKVSDSLQRICKGSISN